MIEHNSDPSTTMAANAVDADQGATQSGLPQPEMSGRRWMVSVFGDITRSGSWPPRRTTSPIALFGDIDLDFRQATMPSGGVVLDAVAPFGNIDVVVPAGSHVDVGGARCSVARRCRSPSRPRPIRRRRFSSRASPSSAASRYRARERGQSRPRAELLMTTAADVAPPPIGRGATRPPAPVGIGHPGVGVPLAVRRRCRALCRPQVSSG